MSAIMGQFEVQKTWGQDKLQESCRSVRHKVMMEKYDARALGAGKSSEIMGKRRGSGFWVMGNGRDAWLQKAARVLGEGQDSGCGTLFIWTLSIGLFTYFDTLYFFSKKSNCLH